MNRDDIYDKRSKSKLCEPYTVKKELTFYCPQENYDSLINNKRINDYHEYMIKDYNPAVTGSNVVMLLLPCVKRKPYSLSSEHMAINKYLFEAGFKPTGESEYPEQLKKYIKTDEQHLLNNTVLKRDNVYLHRVVLSEPMALVPYEYIYYYNDTLSMFAQYDDPGLFEHRGITVCPWRSDCTAIPKGKKYGWGPNEKEAYVDSHNILAERIGAMLKRLNQYYGSIIGYVAPKMTHRSFLASTYQKKEMGLPTSRLTARGKANLIGVNDIHQNLVVIVPDSEEIKKILINLKKRLKVYDDKYVKSYLSTGGGVATALVLPETLRILDAHLKLGD